MPLATKCFRALLHAYPAAFREEYCDEMTWAFAERQATERAWRLWPATILEILWTAVPAILVTAIGIVSAVVLARNADAGSNALEVEAIGQQFAWKFVYEGDDDNPTGELVLPVNRATRFTMSSVDVIHSFWVPNFGQKMDAVPGIETEIVVTPDRMGEFEVVCTELCGPGHATMRARARVVSEADFEAWLEELRA